MIIQTLEHHGLFRRQWNARYRKSLVGRLVVVYGIGRGHKRKIVGTIPKIQGGVIVSKPVDGLTYWNLDSVMLLSKTKT